jgi:hypothetical protein
MRWRGGRRSGNVEDRRGRGALIGGGAGGLVLLVVALLLGVDPGELTQNGSTPPAVPGAAGAPEDELGEFVDVVLGTTEDTWNARFAEAGRSYEEPTLVLFTGAVQSACGFARAAVGPFYCPRDRYVYIDLSFFRDLQGLGASGDFAQAYVIAHEVGHHVQTLLGISDDVRSQQARSSEAETNALQVRMELQADCLAGVWAHDVAQAGLLEAGDVDEALTAAAAIGDDRLQMRGQGYVVPESFTHGTAEQRASWFRTGLDTGRVDACETFEGPA